MVALDLFKNRKKQPKHNKYLISSNDVVYTDKNYIFKLETQRLQKRIVAYNKENIIVQTSVYSFSASTDILVLEMKNILNIV